MMRQRKRPECSELARLGVAVWTAMVCTAVEVGARETVQILEDSDERIVLRYDLETFDMRSVLIQGTRYTQIELADESPTKIVGAPELPVIDRSIIIPDDAKIVARVVERDGYEISGIDIAPSRGILYRSEDPAQVAHPFGREYDTDAFFPDVMVDLRQPYILREHRGVVVELYPFQYNPVTRVLRVTDSMTVELVPEGAGEANVLVRESVDRRSAAFSQMYRHHFLNTGGRCDRYDDLDESGAMLIIAHDDWLPNVEPLVDHKNSFGIPTTAVGVSTIGNTVAAIDSYIHSAYATSNLTFVLLVGDAVHVATPSSYGGASDPSYAKISGGDDYPEILVGRMSAEIAAHVDTQVQRTIDYETLPATGQQWSHTGVGVGSDQGPGDDGEMDWEHLDVIRDALLNYGFSQVDQIYDPGGSSTVLSNALDEGRGLVNYTGHGWNGGWSTTGFSNADVNNLVNDSMLPFIVSVACDNGAFDNGTCFAESWMRARNGSQPTGAIAVYMSSISQSWSPPMAAQDEIMDLLIAESYFAFGALAFAGSCLMMDEYAAVDMFDTWHVFGDPSLRVVGAPSALQVEPAEHFVAFGTEDVGLFAPPTGVFTVSNIGDHPIDFDITVSQPWVSIDPPSGTLGVGNTQDLLLSIITGADTVQVGQHGATIWFTNVTDQDGDTERAVILVVDERPEAETEPIPETKPGVEDITGTSGAAEDDEDIEHDLPLDDDTAHTPDLPPPYTVEMPADGCACRGGAVMPKRTDVSIAVLGVFAALRGLRRQRRRVGKPTR